MSLRLNLYSGGCLWVNQWLLTRSRSPGRSGSAETSALSSVSASAEGHVQVGGCKRRPRQSVFGHADAVVIALAAGPATRRQPDLNRRGRVEVEQFPGDLRSRGGFGEVGIDRLPGILFQKAHTHGPHSARYSSG